MTLSGKLLSVLLLTSILLLSSVNLLNPSHGFASSTGQGPDPFAKPDQIIFDFSPPEKVNGPPTSNAFASPMLNSLFQGVDNREVCGDHKDNNKNGQIDENCSAVPLDEQNSIIEHMNGDYLIQTPPSSTPKPQDVDNESSPEQEICADGQDNNGNGVIDENCAVPDPEQEICADGQDNNGNGVIDENCDQQQEEPPVSNPSEDDNPDDESNPEQEICADGQDNDGNGVIDENCDQQQEEPPLSNPSLQDDSDD